MQLLLGFLIAAVIGVALHFVLPGKSLRGVVLAPAIAAATGTLAWTILTWVGLGPENPLLWLSAVVVPVVITVPAVTVLTALRTRHDETVRSRLRIT